MILRSVGVADDRRGEQSTTRHSNTFALQTRIAAEVELRAGIEIVRAFRKDQVWDEAARGISTQIYYVLVLLTKSRALDKVQAAGEGEGL